MPKAVDKHPQSRSLGAALYNPNRSGISSYEDPYSAIDDTALQAGTGIRGTIDSVLDDIAGTVLSATGLDISGPVALLEQLLSIPLAFVDSTPLGNILAVLGMFLPFLGGSNPDTFDPTSAGSNFLTNILNPTGLLALLTSPFGFLNPLHIPGLDASKITSGALADGLIPGLLGLMGNIFGGLTGHTGTDADADQAAVGEATASQTQVLATISAQVAKLQAMLVTDDPSVIIVEDSFEYTGPLDPAKWSVIDLGPATTGTWTVDGHQLYFDQVGTQDRTLLFPYIGPNADAADDLIGVKIVLGDEIGVQSSALPCAHDLILRKNATNTQYTRLRLFPKSWELAAMNSGTKTVIATQTLSTQPAAGSIISADAGTEANHAARTFTIKVNTASWTINDAAGASFVGAGYRGRGLGARFGQRVFFGANQQIQPGPVAHWVSENNPIA